MTKPMERRTVIEVLVQLRRVLGCMCPSNLNDMRIRALTTAVGALQAFPLDLLKVHPNQMN